MKNSYLILLALVFFIGGYLFADKESNVVERVVVETDTLLIGYDSVFVSALERNNETLSKKYKELLRFIRNQKPDTVKDYRVDTLIIEKEKKPVYSSNFRIGTDTLNATGIVAFDFSRFYFSNVNFRYPQRTITKIKFVEKTNWTWVAVGAAVGVVIGAVAK